MTMNAQVTIGATSSGEPVAGGKILELASWVPIHCHSHVEALEGEVGTPRIQK